jgi:uncharacterized DUF497 family protein
MRYTWDPKKRPLNLKEHQLDFVDVEKVFAGPTYTYEDDRFRYKEQRFVTLGLLQGIPVSIAHTETDDEIHSISFRRATPNETIILFENIADQLPPPPVDKKQGHPAEPGASRGRRKTHRPRNRTKRPKGRSS